MPELEPADPVLTLPEDTAAPTEPGTVLTERDRYRLNRVLGGLPFGAGIVHTHQGVRTVDELVGVLDRLADRLGEHARSDHDTQTELEELRRLLHYGQKLFRALSEPGSGRERG